MVKGIYQFSWTTRYGVIEGAFVSNTHAISDLIGKKVYFGECLGKHSEIYGDVSSEDIELITEDQEFVAAWEEKFGSFGYNPFDYIQDELE